MSLLVCCISGVVPSDPVFVAKTGLLYSRRLLESALQQEGRCPVTRIELAPEDVAAVRTDVDGAAPPRVPETTSIPALLKHLQTEWDATALETFKLRQLLDKTRKELAQALYQQDAASRVIARLTKERDEARAGLGSATVASNGVSTGAAAAAPSAPAAAPRDLSPDEEVRIRELAKSLASSRKKRKAEAKTEGVEAWSRGEIALPAGAGVGVHMDDDQGLIAVAAASTVTLVSRQERKAKETFSFQAPVARAVVLNPQSTHGARLMVASGPTVRVFGHSGAAELVLPSTATGCAVHASGEYGLACESAGFLTLFRLGSGQVARSLRADKGPMTCLDAHPDGLLVATGGESHGAVQVWSLLDGKAVTALREHAGFVSALAFSGNGTKLASVSSRDATVRVWDLRQTASALHTLKGRGVPTGASFDPSGSLVGVCYEDGSLVVSSVSKGDDAWPVVLQDKAPRPLAGLAFGSGGVVAVNDQASLVTWAP